MKRTRHDIYQTTKPWEPPNVQAFDFELQDIHGKTWRLADFTDDWLLMVFHRHLG